MSEQRRPQLMPDTCVGVGTGQDQALWMTSCGARGARRLMGVGGGVQGRQAVLAAERVQACFPWTRPQKYISLRDDQGNEIALINDLDYLDASSRKLVRQALAETSFVMQIEAVLSRQEEFEVRTWDVRTKQGRRKFQTKRDAWPQALPDGGLLIRDIAGDLFYIASPHNMDHASKILLAPFID